MSSSGLQKADGWTVYAQYDRRVDLVLFFLSDLMFFTSERKSSESIFSDQPRLVNHTTVRAMSYDISDVYVDNWTEGEIS